MSRRFPTAFRGGLCESGKNRAGEYGERQRSGGGPWPLGIAVAGAALAFAAPADAARPTAVEELQQLSIEELANLEVTSAFKRPEALRRTPAAIYVITAEDI